MLSGPTEWLELAVDSTNVLRRPVESTAQSGRSH